MTPEESKYTLPDIIKRVQSLLARAESDSVPPAEAALARHHAERLMRVWRIKEEGMLASDPSSISPISHQVFVANGEFYLDLATLLRLICNHSDVMMDLTWGRMNNEGPWGVVATLVGFEVDINQAEWLFSSARLHFRAHLEPEVDSSLSDQENVYRLRRAGMLRKEVALLVWGQNTPSLRSKAQRMYMAECYARGETPQLEGLGTDAKTFRSAYARGFVDRVSDRLRRARDAADSDGRVMVLAGRAERVREAFYELFPKYRPSTEVSVPVASTTKYRGPTKAEIRRSTRQYYSHAAQAGLGEGATAADKVEIKRLDPTKRIES